MLKDWDGRFTKQNDKCIDKNPILGTEIGRHHGRNRGHVVARTRRESLGVSSFDEVRDLPCQNTDMAAILMYVNANSSSCLSRTFANNQLSAGGMLQQQTPIQSRGQPLPASACSKHGKLSRVL